MNDRESQESLTEHKQIAPNEGGVDARKSDEIVVSRTLETGQPTTQLPDPQVPPATLPDPVQSATSQLAGSVAQPANELNTVSPVPAIADDADLIEKEWVVRAKHIVEQTRHDPYIQNQEVNKMKAEYIKKRYGRDIKLAS